MRKLKQNSRGGFTLMMVMIICIGLAGLLTALTMQTLITLDATSAADEALRESLPTSPVEAAP